jgi:hypothetical protein
LPSGTSPTTSRSRVLFRLRADETILKPLRHFKIKVLAIFCGGPTSPTTSRSRVLFRLRADETILKPLRHFKIKVLAIFCGGLCFHSDQSETGSPPATRSL